VFPVYAPDLKLALTWGLIHALKSRPLDLEVRHGAQLIVRQFSE